MKSIKRIWNSFKIAFSMYSRIPMPRSEWTDENKSYAMCFFPWIGAVIGLLSYGVFRFSKWFDGNGGGNYSLFFVIFLILIPVFITGGIHLDGFLDTQDALSSWQTKERRLEILKDSHAGAFAIISCTVYFLMYIGVYSCLSVRSMEVIAYSFMLSRTLSGLSVVTFPQARKKGMVADFSERNIEEIFDMVGNVEKKALKDLAEMSFEWVYSAEGEDAEEKFHEFVYGTITNGLFRRLLETSADCYIRFASEETEMGKDPEQKQLRRNKLETVHSAYCRKDTVVMEVALEEYYRLLTENVKKERGFEK